MTRVEFAAAAAVLVALSSAGLAADRPMPGQVQRLFACRSIADSGQRLQCFDRESAAAAAAMAKRDLVFIDRERVKLVRKERFGLTAPDFGGLFGNDKDDVDQIESTVASASETGGGGLMVTLADGSVWTQSDDVFLGVARPGRKVVVRRAVMGAYRMSIQGLAAFKAKRVR